MLKFDDVQHLFHNYNHRYGCIYKLILLKLVTVVSLIPIIIKYKHNFFDYFNSDRIIELFKKYIFISVKIQGRHLQDTRMYRSSTN